MPESFKVLIKELQSLGLDIKVLGEDKQEIIIREMDDDEDEGINSEAEELLSSPAVSTPSLEDEDEGALDDEEDFNLDEVPGLDDISLDDDKVDKDSLLPGDFDLGDISLGDDDGMNDDE